MNLTVRKQDASAAFQDYTPNKNVHYNSFSDVGVETYGGTKLPPHYTYASFLQCVQRTFSNISKLLFPYRPLRVHIGFPEYWNLTLSSKCSVKPKAILLTCKTKPTMLANYVKWTCVFLLKNSLNC
jgi:hypothetical protein